jgi:hypothetical protein
VTDAQAALTRAAAGTTKQSEVLAADQAINAAVRSRDDAQATLTQEQQACPAGGCPELVEAQNALADAQDRIALAQAQRAEVGGTVDTSGERSSLTAAQQALADAKTDLATAQEETLTALPASEVVFLETVPRRVDAVSVKRGGTVDGSVMSVSGATLQVVASASRTDAELLAVGAKGTIPVDGAEVPVTVTEITAAAAGAGDGAGSGDGGGQGSGDGSGRYTVTFSPEGLTPEQVAALQGSNVRVSVPVSSTGGAVLAVPLAAITAGPGGESRVEVLDDDASTLVEVTTGLAAGGYVEVTGVDQDLHEGDLVVVGATAGDDPEATAEPDAEDDA